MARRVQLVKSTDPLTAVKAATSRRTRSERAWRDAIRDAHAAGVSLRVIGAAAGVSHVWVLKIVQAGEKA